MEIEQQTDFQEQDQLLHTQSSQSEIKLVPYVELDGEWILSEEFLDNVFQKVIDQGLLKITFWEGTVTDESDFVGLAKSPNNHMVFFFEGRNCVGFAWLGPVISNYAFDHFCLFKEVWGRSIQIGLDCVDYWFSWPGTGGPLLDVIIGLMPGFNTRAHKFVERLGWTRLGVIPGMFRDQDRNREDAVIFYKTRE